MSPNRKFTVLQLPGWLQRGVSLTTVAVLAATATACGSSGGTRAPTASTGNFTSVVSLPVTSENATSPSATDSAAGSVDLNFDLPLHSAKGYQGNLHISSPAPQVILGDPGKVTVAGVDSASGMVTDQTVGGRPAFVDGEEVAMVGVDVYLAWALSPQLAKDAGGPYLLEVIDLAAPDNGAPAQVTTDQPLPLQPAPVRGLTVATIGDRDGFPINANGASLAAPVFPETEQSALAQLLGRPPNIVFFTPGYSAGFTFGGASDKTAIVCHITPTDNYASPYNVYGVVNGLTGHALSWTTARSTPGQPCHSKYAAPPQ
jgi:hypothetical protein